MILAVLSGKGGAGKTTIAASLIKTLSKNNKVLALDLDVETPQLSSRLDVEDSRKLGDVFTVKAYIDENLCRGCGICRNKCRFGAILWQPGKKAKILEEGCEGCMLCKYFCPFGAIKEKKIKIGEIRKASLENLEVVTFEALPEVEETSEVIKAGLNYAKALKNLYDFVIIDAPPGSRAGVAEIAEVADKALVVVEATKPGIKDALRLLSIIPKEKVIIIFNKAFEEMPADAFKDAVGICTVPFMQELFGESKLLAGDELKCVLRLLGQRVE